MGVINCPYCVESPFVLVKDALWPFLYTNQYCGYFHCLCEPGQSETIFFLPIRCSFTVAVAAGGVETARIFQIDFSYLHNKVEQQCEAWDKCYG